MKVDLTNMCLENIKIQNTSLIGGNFAKSNLNGSELNNVNISGVNLNGALLINCNWRNLKLHELNKLKGHNETVCSVSISSDDTTLASGSSDHSILLWDIKTG